MADFRPFHGLRYQTNKVGSLGDVVAPPFDVISDEAQAALYQRSPYNVVRLEYSQESSMAGGNRYRLAAATLAAWRRDGVLRTDDRPCYYLYEQEFAYAARRYCRHTIIGRARLEPWEAGVILPHEHTMSGPKQDRLRLLRACRANISPIFSLYRSDGGQALAWCEAASAGVAPEEATDGNGDHHRLWTIDDPLTVDRLRRHFSDHALYIADGHHRYETALTYRDERAAAEVDWSGDEPENFVLMGLTAADDAGLLILPIHRLVRPPRRPHDLRDAISASFDVAVQVPPVAASPGTAQLAVLGVEPGRSLLLTVRDRAGVEKLMPRGRSAAWRSLDVNVLQYGVLQPLLGINIDTLREGSSVEFTDSAQEALAAVESGRVPLAFLVNATRPDQIFAVADAGERMPQKSTFFYPKLGAGLVIYALDANPVSEVAAL